MEYYYELDGHDPNKLFFNFPSVEQINEYLTPIAACVDCLPRKCRLLVFEGLLSDKDIQNAKLGIVVAYRAVNPGLSASDIVVDVTRAGEGLDDHG